MRPNSLALSLNHAPKKMRDDANQWVHLLPAGRFHGRDGRTFIASDMAKIIDCTRSRAGSSQLPIDYEHQIDFAPKNGQPAPAAGWIKGLQSRADGVWGLVEWTPRAIECLAQREYRYLSPTFLHRPDGTVTTLLRAGLTNIPNLELKALARTEDNMDDLTELRQLLNLPDDADVPTITEAVRTLLSAANAAATPDPAKYVPIGDFARVTTELNKLNKGVSQHAAEIAVSDQIARGRLPPFLEEWGVALCSSNKPAFDSFVERTGGTFAKLSQSICDGPPPINRNKDQANAEADIFRRLGLTS